MNYELTQISPYLLHLIYLIASIYRHKDRANSVAPLSLQVYTKYIYIGMVYHTEEGQTVITY